MPYTCMICKKNVGDKHTHGPMNFTGRPIGVLVEDPIEEERIEMDKISLYIKHLMMRYLRKRGWVVFYLEPEHRECNGMCWPREYEQEERADESSSVV